MAFLGLDPSYNDPFGWVVMEDESTVLQWGCFTFSPCKWSDMFVNACHKLVNELQYAYAQYGIREVFMEGIYVNPKMRKRDLIRLAQFNQHIYATIYFRMQIKPMRIHPLEAKKAVFKGNATKEQVAYMVEKITNKPILESSKLRRYAIGDATSIAIAGIKKLENQKIYEKILKSS